MQIIASILLILYNFISLLYFKKHFSERYNHWFYYVLAITINLGCSYIADLVNLHQIGVLIIMASFMLELRLLFKMDFLRVLHGGSAYIIILFACRGIIASVFSIILKKSINDVLQQEFYYYIIMSIALVVAIAFLMLVKNVIAPDNRIKPSFSDTKEMKAIVCYQVAILIYLLILNQGRFFDINALWFSTHYLASFLIAIGLLSFIWNTIVRVTELLEYELITKRLQEQLDRQISHYISYKKLTESYRIFKHDYQDMMTMLKILIKNNENEKAVNLLDEIHDKMQKNVQIHKTYSDNVLLDAILQDTANICEEYNIRFNATIHLPVIIGLKDIDVVRICSNVINNAIEACHKIPDAYDKFININGSVNQDWSFIEIANSFSGELIYKDGELVTTKASKDFHGFGILIIRQIIEDIGGMILIEVDQEKKIFILKLHIPRREK